MRHLEKNILKMTMILKALKPENVLIYMFILLKKVGRGRRKQEFSSATLTLNELYSYSVLLIRQGCIRTRLSRAAGELSGERCSI